MIVLNKCQKMMKNLIKILLILFLPLIFSCGHNPSFLITNQTNHTLTMEFKFSASDSLTEKGGEYMSLRGYLNYYFFNEGSKRTISWEKIDSLQTVFDSASRTSLMGIFKDSVTVRTLFLIENPRIINLEKKYGGDFLEQKLSQYYSSDSNLINKIIDERTITLFLPSKTSFIDGCYSSEINDNMFYPNFSSIYVKYNDRILYTLTPQNIPNVMSKRLYPLDRNNWCYILEVD